MKRDISLPLFISTWGIIYELATAINTNILMEVTELLTYLKLYLVVKFLVGGFVIFVIILIDFVKLM